jgi:hypothetical protein
MVTGTTPRHIERKAARIYRLVRSGRETEALRLIDTLGEDFHAVISCLIEGALSFSPIARYSLVTGCLGMIALPCVITYSWLNFESPYMLPATLKPLCSIVLFIASGFAECMLIGQFFKAAEFIRLRRNRPTTWKLCMDMVQKVLLDRRGEAIQNIALLVNVAGCEYSSNADTNINPILDLISETVPELSREQADALAGSCSERLDHLLDSVLCGFVAKDPSERNRSHATTGPPETAAKLALAILSNMEKETVSRDFEEVSFAEEALKLDVDSIPEPYKDVCRELKRIWPVLEQRRRDQYQGSALLRASAPETAGSQQLLRATAQAGQQADELLHVSNGQGTDSS